MQIVKLLFLVASPLPLRFYYFNIFINKKIIYKNSIFTSSIKFRLFFMVDYCFYIQFLYANPGWEVFHMGTFYMRDYFRWGFKGTVAIFP
jgi:hypothetical protein